MTNSSEKKSESTTSVQLDSSNGSDGSDGFRTDMSFQTGPYSDYIKSLEHLRCRIDVMDMSNQPDGDFNHILVYEDDATTFTCLKPLQRADPIAISNAIIDIFCELGSTLIVCTRSPHFGLAVTSEIRNQWPGSLVVSGRNISENERLIFNKNRDRVKRALAEWRDEHRSTRWSLGMRFIQWGLNSQGNTNNDGCRQVNLMNERALLGVSSLLPSDIVAELETEEELINALIAQGN